MAGNFLEQIQAAREAAQAPEPEAPDKPAEELTDAELEGAITEARRRLLDAQRAELREREIARVAGAGEATGRPTGLREFLGGLQRHKRRTWR
jgi:hypothetical protein